MALRLLGGSANPPLLATIAGTLGLAAEERVLERFPDGELHVVLERTQHAAHVAIVQPTGPPVDEHLVELVMLADASRRAGATRITAVVPYFGYARQDHRSTEGEAIGAKALAGVIEAAGVDRLVVVDAHSTALETMFGIRVHALTAVPILAGALRPLVRGEAIVVAPDLGAVKLAERYAAALDLPVAIVRKRRLSGEQVHAVEVVGDVRDRRPLIVDDMITTAGTMEAAARAVLDRGCRPEVILAATHGLFVGPARERLGALPVEHLVVSDTVRPPSGSDLRPTVVGVGGLLADTLASLSCE
jgi:ribose-phosphate pyrophosphokinase